MKDCWVYIYAKIYICDSGIFVYLFVNWVAVSILFCPSCDTVSLKQGYVYITQFVLFISLMNVFFIAFAQIISQSIIKTSSFLARKITFIANCPLDIFIKLIFRSFSWKDFQKMFKIWLVIGFLFYLSLKRKDILLFTAYIFLLFFLTIVNIF